MSKKLMILAAGMSSRMKSSTSDLINKEQFIQANNYPKCMIEIGKDKTPFLEFLIKNAIKSKINEICLIINEKDQVTKNYLLDKNFNVKIKFVIQAIPQLQKKPMGTADAVLQGINKCKLWGNDSFIVCNSDNLYSTNVFSSLLNSSFPNAMIEYEFNKLGLDSQRIHAFSIINKDSNGYLLKIIEKPNILQVKNYTKKGHVGVSMNIFKLKPKDILPYLKKCPINTLRNEKELPMAVQMMVNNNKKMKVISKSEKVADLTEKSDIINIEKLINYIG